MNFLTTPLKDHRAFSGLISSIKEKTTPVLMTGVIDVDKTNLIYGVTEATKAPAVIITGSPLKAKEICSDLKFYTRDVLLFPARDLVFLNADVHSRETDILRLKCLDSLARGEKKIIVVEAPAVLDRFMPKSDFSKFCMEFKLGDTLNPEELFKKLIYMGYERAEIVEGPGQFLQKGGIIDVFPSDFDAPVRIELWDDEIDSIRIVDVYSQRSIEKIPSFRISPLSESACDEASLSKALKLIEKETETEIKRLVSTGKEEEADSLCEYISELTETVKVTGSFPDSGRFISYLYPKTVSLLDYLPENAVIFYDEPKRIKSFIDATVYEYAQSAEARIQKGAALPSQKELLYSYGDILFRADRFPQVALSAFDRSLLDFKAKEVFNMDASPAPCFYGDFKAFLTEVRELKSHGFSIVIFSLNQPRAERTAKELTLAGISAAYYENAKAASEAFGKQVIITRGNLRAGFMYNKIKLAVFTDKELFEEKYIRRPTKKKKKAAAIQSFTDLKPGDYVVHDSHGIGIFRGLEKITVDNISRDYLKISYAAGGNLFVPVSQMDVIQKFIGGNAKVKLNKLGGTEWARTKAKTKVAVSDMADKLIELYAKRRASKGFQFSPDTIWQKEFEETFPYEETDDQLMAIADVKKDMESTLVMDRLICGDVGYGKTEIALRAAFKAAQDGKQTAFLVPTTILAEQHFNTFTERMSAYPIKIEHLSRFKTASEQKESLKRLEAGLSDIVIGTHRLLSHDVKFKDLGLIIIDEEQRFGVAHKEKLKALKTNADVLTLTATPIPRTLHMSLSGIRDMSLLTEPPEERRPVRTYVLENDPEFVKNAIHRELARGGQVYYLHNRTATISETAFKLQNMIPEAKIAFAHGQMTEFQLENVMKDFIDGKTDCLVCTTIIETGLDIPNVNTIIIQDADRYGLSQLYQLRGRVGRSSRVAYAYFMYKKDKALKEISEKRLQTIKEFTQFGSGFKIALRDLEIRGAGNLLGAEQHGHMAAVGYDMYCRLLDAEIKNKKGEKEPETFETSIDLNINAYIPAFYIKNVEQRLEIYKKISIITNMDDYFDVQEEIEDRFGDIPKTVSALFEVMLLKAEAHTLGVISIAQKHESILISFKPDAPIDPLRLTEALKSAQRKYFFTSGVNPYITIKITSSDGFAAIEEVKTLFNKLKA